VAQILPVSRIISTECKYVRLSAYEHQRVTSSVLRLIISRRREKNYNFSRAFFSRVDYTPHTDVREVAIMARRLLNTKINFETTQVEYMFPKCVMCCFAFLIGCPFDADHTTRGYFTCISLIFIISKSFQIIFRS
jgi:hypothetical protein